MTNAGTPFLNALETRLGDRGKETLYLCIRDLVEHGLDLARFAAGETKPQRQDITQYLAAWSRHVGLSEEESRAWLIEYCATLLASISRRTPNAIRHSTKSNLKYIYGSAVPFLCQGESNPFRAHCRPDCPVYAEMQIKRLEKAKELLQPRVFVRPPAPLIQTVLPVKVVHQEQFQTGLRLAHDEAQKGTKKPRIVELLNERGLKTRTGRKWTYRILCKELRTVQNSPVPPQAGGQDPGPSEHSDPEQDAP